MNGGKNIKFFTIEYVTGLLTIRLQSLGALSNNMQANEKILVNGTKQEVTDLLSCVNGVGPMVLNNFLFLRDK